MLFRSSFLFPIINNDCKIYQLLSNNVPRKRKNKSIKRRGKAHQQKVTVGSGWSSMVEHLPRNQEIVDSNLLNAWPFSVGSPLTGPLRWRSTSHFTILGSLNVQIDAK